MRSKYIIAQVTLIFAGHALANEVLGSLLDTINLSSDQIDHATSFEFINGEKGAAKDDHQMDQSIIIPFIQSLGEESINSDSKIDLGFEYFKNGNSGEMRSVSKDLSELKQADSGITESVKNGQNLHVHDGEEPKRTFDEVIPKPRPLDTPTFEEIGEKHAVFGTITGDGKPISPTTALEVPIATSWPSGPLPVKQTEASQVKPQDEPVFEDTETSREIIAAPRPTQSRRILTRTKTMTNTIGPVPDSINQEDQTIFTEVTQTFYSLAPTKTSVALEATFSPRPPSDLPLSSPYPLPAAPSPAPSPAQGISPVLGAPIPHPFLQAPTLEAIPTNTPVPQPDEITVQIEQTIKETIEKYLKERLEQLAPKLLPVPIPEFDSKTIGPVQSLPTSGSTNGIADMSTSSINAIPTLSSGPQIVGPEENVKDELAESIITDVEENLGPESEHLNVERLRNVLRSVLNSKIPGASVVAERNGSIDETSGGELPKKSQDDGYHPKAREVGTLQRENATDSEQTRQEPQASKSLIEILDEFNDKFDSQGLSDKDLEKLKKTQNSIDKLKEIPEDVLELLFSDEKRQALDNLLHKPFLKKIGLDMTNVKEEELLEENELLKDNGRGAKDKDPTTPATEQISEEELFRFDNLNRKVDEEVRHRLDEEQLEIATSQKERYAKIPVEAIKGKNGSSTGSEKSGFDFVFEDKRPMMADKDANLSRSEKDSNRAQQASHRKSSDGTTTEADLLPSSISSQPIEEENLESSNKPSLKSKNSKQKERPESFMDKFKMNPSLLFTGENDNLKKDSGNDLFDFTKSGSNGQQHKLSTVTMAFAIVFSMCVILI